MAHIARRLDAIEERLRQIESILSILILPEQQQVIKRRIFEANGAVAVCLETVGSYYNLNNDELSAIGRTARQVEARYITMEMLRVHAGLDKRAIGMVLSRTRGLVEHGQRALQKWVETDRAMARRISDINNAIKAKLEEKYEPRH